MHYRSLGHSGESLSALGLGCMVMNHGYGQPDEPGSLATLHQALDLGINFWDTADVYAQGENEKLISRVLRPNRNRIFLASKFGLLPGASGTFMGVDGSPAYVKKAVVGSLQRLQTDVIDLYYLHRLDPKIPIEETVGALADLVQEGKIRYIGLSEVSAQTLQRAHATYPISALQSEYSILTREVEKEILPVCKRLGITFVPFSPLSRGLLSNTLDTASLTASDFRKKLPRYQATYEKNNSALVHEFAQLAKSCQATAAQLALAWLLYQGENIIPIPGTKKVKYLIENAGAVDISLDTVTLNQIEELLRKYPETGPRYDEANDRLVDR